MAMERLHIMVPKGTKKQAKIIAKRYGYPTPSEYIREVIKDDMTRKIIPVPK